MRAFAILCAASLAIAGCTKAEADEETAEAEAEAVGESGEAEGGSGLLADEQDTSAEIQPTLTSLGKYGELSGAEPEEDTEAADEEEPAPYVYRAPFDEHGARSRAEMEVSGESYRSVGRPYGCTVDCSGHEAGFKYRARQGYGGRIAGDYDARSFRQGQQAYDDEVDRRVEESREEYEQSEPE